MSLQNACTILGTNTEDSEIYPWILSLLSWLHFFPITLQLKKSMTFTLRTNRSLICFTLRSSTDRFCFTLKLLRRLDNQLPANSLWQRLHWVIQTVDTLKNSLLGIGLWCHHLDNSQTISVSQVRISRMLLDKKQMALLNCYPRSRLHKTESIDERWL